jgi:hypothetical protein
MSRSVFFSFHYKPDNWRASQVRNAGVVEGNKAVSDNDWESITSGGDSAIEKWIAGQMSGKSAAIVLVGNATAGRKWINHEIIKAWNDKKGVVGVHIHNLLNSSGDKSTKGSNPFAGVTMGSGGAKMSTIVKCYDPPYATSTNVYDHIKQNLEDWVEEAITIRNNY